ncbi:MAG: hypothetical protein R3300_11740 [Candidatus Promineifilaceae bacterium]|nr:hypothetical protein [Candidatus Promineifilaceae bacterium]
MFEQERVLVRLRQHILRDEAIINCFLAGSFGRGKADAYSDLELMLIFEHRSARDVAFRSRRAFARHALPYVASKSYDAEHMHPFLHVALYANGAKVSYCYETQQTLTPGALGPELSILKDRDGWAKRYVEASSGTAPLPASAAITSEALFTLDSRFWVMLMDVFRQVLRGDLERPFPVYLEMLYLTIPQLLKLLPPEEQARQALLHVRFDGNRKATIEDLRALMHGYLTVRDAIVRRHQLDFSPDEAFESAIAGLIDRLAEQASK